MLRSFGSWFDEAADPHLFIPIHASQLSTGWCQQPCTRFPRNLGGWPSFSYWIIKLSSPHKVFAHIFILLQHFSRSPCSPSHHWWWSKPQWEETWQWTGGVEYSDPGYHSIGLTTRDMWAIVQLIQHRLLVWVTSSAGRAVSPASLPRLICNIWMYPLDRHNWTENK